MFVAFYVPKLSDDQQDPTAEFSTEELARDYVFSRMCSSCKELRQQALAGNEDGELYPACSCEWFVLPKKDYEESETFEDVLKAAGCKKL